MNQIDRRVHVVPSDIVLEPGEDETVMAAAQRCGYRWPTVCGGHGTCRTCYLLVEDGVEHCSTISGLEAEGITAIGKTVTGEVRLACQLTVSGGPVTVHKRGVKPVTRRTD